jgi:hypothetical protein
MSATLNPKAVVAIVMALLGAGLASCGDSGSGGAGSAPGAAYPAAISESFTTTCAATAKASSGGKLRDDRAKQYCQKALVCVEKKLTLKQFETASANMLNGKANPDAKVVRNCGEAAAK